jgi:hypothetical protein
VLRHCLLRHGIWAGVLHRAAGIEVEPQKEIFDQWGRFVARADLWLVGTRRIHEYDGDGHRGCRSVTLSGG